MWLVRLEIKYKSYTFHCPRKTSELISKAPSSEICVCDVIFLKFLTERKGLHSGWRTCRLNMIRSVRLDSYNNWAWEYVQSSEYTTRKSVMVSHGEGFWCYNSSGSSRTHLSLPICIVIKKGGPAGRHLTSMHCNTVVRESSSIEWNGGITAEWIVPSVLSKRVFPYQSVVSSSKWTDFPFSCGCPINHSSRNQFWFQVHTV